MSLSACNPDRGPEYTTPAEFGEVTVSPQIMSFDSDVTSFDYEGVIPRQRAGRKVTFRIRAITAYNVPSYTQLREYTVPDEEEEESEQPI